MNGPFAGLLVPVLTPFDAQLTPDAKRLTQLCEQLLSCGADGLAVFGTTSEANSMSATERKAVLNDLCSNGIPGEKLMLGIGSCSISETAYRMVAASGRTTDQSVSRSHRGLERFFGRLGKHKIADRNLPETRCLSRFG